MSGYNMTLEQTHDTYVKKDIIYSSTMGLCIVADVTKLSADKNTPPVPYYVLKSYYNKNHVAYIPVEKHEVILRDVIDAEEAARAYEELKKEYESDTDYVPDEHRIGEIAFVMKMTPDELKAGAGAGTGEDETEDTAV